MEIVLPIRFCPLDLGACQKIDQAHDGDDVNKMVWCYVNPKQSPKP